MKLTAGFFVSIILGVLMLTNTQCNKVTAEPGIVSFSYLEPIINPPDTFQIAYNLDIPGNLTAHVTFQDSAVWKIQVLSQSLVNYGFMSPETNAMVYISSPDTVGFQSNKQFSFIANNVNSDMYKGLYFVKFTKLPLDYSTYPHKY